MAQTPNITENKMLKGIKAEPKKAIVLSVLVILMLGLWAKMFLKGGDVPSTAVASTDTPAPLAAAPTPGTVASDKISVALQSWLSTRIPPLGRNLFAVKYEFYPQTDLKPVAPVIGDEGFWGELAKSVNARRDQNQKRDIMVKNLCALATEKVKLQSTMISDGKAQALVDNTLVNEGAVVNGFKIMKIAAGRIVVEREGIWLEIRTPN